MRKASSPGAAPRRPRSIDRWVTAPCAPYSVEAGRRLEQVCQALAKEPRTPRGPICRDELAETLCSLGHQRVHSPSLRVDRLADEHEDLLAEPEILGAGQ